MKLLATLFDPKDDTLIRNLCVIHYCGTRTTNDLLDEIVKSYRRWIDSNNIDTSVCKVAWLYDLYEETDWRWTHNGHVVISRDIYTPVFYSEERKIIQRYDAFK